MDFSQCQELRLGKSRLSCKMKIFLYMTPASGDNQCSPFWSTRKLLICFTIWCNPDRTEYSILDFIFPVRYPRSVRTDSWEVVRIFHCLHQLEDLGIRVKQIKLDPLYFIFSKVHTSSQKKPASYLPIAKIRQKLGRLKSDHFELDELLGNRENRKSIRMKDQNLLILPRFLHFVLEIDRKKLGQVLRGYIGEYYKGKLEKKQSYFGVKFNGQIFDKFIKAMKYRQGQSFHFALGSIEEEDHMITDEFTQVFKNTFSYEAELWQKGIYEFPFFHHLIALHFKKKLTFTQFNIRHDDLEKLLQDHTALDWLGFDEVPLITSLLISIPSKRPDKKVVASVISHIEILESKQDEFIVYVNKVTERPILLSRKQGSGALIYEVATKGFAPYSNYKKAYEYIRKDRRFKLFTKTQTTFKPFLELDSDGYIVPVTDVTIEVKSGNKD